MTFMLQILMWFLFFGASASSLDIYDDTSMPNHPYAVIRCGKFNFFLHCNILFFFNYVTLCSLDASIFPMHLRYSKTKINFRRLPYVSFALRVRYHGNKKINRAKRHRSMQYTQTN